VRLQAKETWYNGSPVAVVHTQHICVNSFRLFLFRLLLFGVSGFYFTYFFKTVHTHMGKSEANRIDPVSKETLHNLVSFQAISIALPLLNIHS
jgi:hypothetical protein